MVTGRIYSLHLMNVCVVVTQLPGYSYTLQGPECLTWSLLNRLMITVMKEIQHSSNTHTKSPFLSYAEGSNLRCAEVQPQESLSGPVVSTKHMRRLNRPTASCRATTQACPSAMACSQSDGLMKRSTATARHHQPTKASPFRIQHLPAAAHTAGPHYTKTNAQHPDSPENKGRPY